MRDHFAWEYKSEGKDLNAAYQQLLQYREALGNPPLLVVSDLKRFQVHTNFDRTQKRIYSFSLDELQKNVPTLTCPLPPLEVLRALFFDCDQLRPERTAARELVRQRDNWLNPPGASPEDLAKLTLTNLYNKRPKWLENAHRKLDEAVFAAYGWPAALTDAELLERLLALNHERAAS